MTQILEKVFYFPIDHLPPPSCALIPHTRDVEVRDTAFLAVRWEENELNEVIIHISNDLGQISITTLLNGDDDNVLESIPEDQLALSIFHDLNISAYAVSADEREGSGSKTVSISI